MTITGLRSRTIATALAASAGAAILVGVTPTAAFAESGHTASGTVNANGTWTRGSVVRTAETSDYLDGMVFNVTDLPGCCLDIRIREASGAEYLRSEIYNIQIPGLTATSHPNAGIGTPTRNFRIWSRNSVVGSDRSWSGVFYY